LDGIELVEDDLVSHPTTPVQMAAQDRQLLQAGLIR